MTSNTTPCRIVVLPVPNDSMIVNRARSNKSIDFVSIPSVTEKPANTDTIATAGMVSPMLANAEPSARFKLV